MLRPYFPYLTAFPVLLYIYEVKRINMLPNPRHSIMLANTYTPYPGSGGAR